MSEKADCINWVEVDAPSEVVLPYDGLARPPEDVESTKILLEKLVVLKLNGDHGQNMGCIGPKASIEVHNGLTFLDLIVIQIEIQCPPIITEDPVSGEGNSRKDVCHPLDQGDIFTSLNNSGYLDVSLAEGKEYVFIADSDNVGAIIDIISLSSTEILNHVISNQNEYCIEVTPKTPTDVIGSALISYEGRVQVHYLFDVQLEQLTQPFLFLLSFCLSMQVNDVKEVEKFKLLTTNNLWVNLKAIKRLIEVELLKMEITPKSKEIYGVKVQQLESPAGIAIHNFNKAIGINVLCSRFCPVKTTSDLLLVQSDLYTLNDGSLIRNPARVKPSDPLIELGPEFKEVTNFLDRFRSIPSVIELDKLEVSGDVWFGSDIKLKGEVTITAKFGVKSKLPDGLVLENKV
ncbi:hypothetical protein EJB05_43842, partial [Eragrostis curvula]